MIRLKKITHWTLSPCNGKVKLTAEMDGKMCLVHVTKIKDEGNHLTAKVGDVTYILVK